MRYELTKSELSRLKSSLTKAVKSGSSAAVIRAHDEAMAIFEQRGYPDCWQDWERAKSDVEMAAAHRGPWRGF